MTPSKRDQEKQDSGRAKSHAASQIIADIPKLDFIEYDKLKNIKIEKPSQRPAPKEKEGIQSESKPKLGGEQAKRETPETEETIFDNHIVPKQETSKDQE